MHIAASRQNRSTFLVTDRHHRALTVTTTPPLFITYLVSADTALTWAHDLATTGQHIHKGRVHTGRTINAIAGADGHAAIHDMHMAAYATHADGPFGSDYTPTHPEADLLATLLADRLDPTRTWTDAHHPLILNDAAVLLTTQPELLELARAETRLAARPIAPRTSPGHGRTR